MIKKTISYTDFDGNQRTEDFYFNLSKAEIMEMQLSKTGGLEKYIQKIISEQDNVKLMEIFKELILKSYGQKSPDGKRFIKNQELRDEFEQTEAYSEFFFELATDSKAATDFVNGIIPKGLEAEIKKLQSEGKAPAEITG